MKSLSIRLFALATLAIFAFSCKKSHPRIERAFYYWKDGRYTLEDKELLALKDQKIQKLYIKFFEIGLDSVLGAIPTVKTELHLWDYNEHFENDSTLHYTLKNLEITPVIYLKNSVLFKTSHGSLDTLADNINFLTEKYFKSQIQISDSTYSELQIDCDWTERTRDNYFYLLSQLKQSSRKTISCTLRLYPYKYREKLGVPPADKAVLMCYNLISPLSTEDKNSILDVEELRKYLQNSPSYPLHLDFALPIFSWRMVYQNNQFAGLLHSSGLSSDSLFKPTAPMWSEVQKDLELGNLYLRKGDKIKTEEITANTLQKAAETIRKLTSPDSVQTIVLFHLDADNLTKFDHETLDSIFAAFGK